MPMHRAAFQEALEDILDVPKGSLRDSDSRDTVENWTSVADIQILTAISSEFGIEADADLLQADTVGDLMWILDGRGAFRA